MLKRCAFTLTVLALIIGVTWASHESVYFFYARYGEPVATFGGAFVFTLVLCFGAALLIRLMSDRS